MSNEELLVRGVISTQPQEHQDKINATAQAMRELIDPDLATGLIALSLVCVQYSDKEDV